MVQFTLHQREAARMVPNFAQPEPIILAYGTVTCASAQVPAIRPARGFTRIAPNIMIKSTSTIALDPPLNVELHAVLSFAG